MFSSATRHEIYYPTRLLKILQTGVQVGDKTASLIAPGFKIPHMLGFSSDYIFTKPYKTGALSLYAGVNLGLVFGDIDPRTSIDLPLVYHRLGVFYNKYGLDAGIDFSKNITDQIKAISESTERLSSGKRVNRAADDPSVIGPISRLNSQILSVGQAIQNGAEGKLLTQTTSIEERSEWK